MRNPVFWDFSRYYSFRPNPHRPYRPQTKGKVESGVKYVTVYKGAKGSVQFPIDKPLSLELIGKIVKYRVSENIKKYEDKLKNK